MTPATADWRYKDENFQKRHFILSGFVRMKISLTRDVYEFCDYAINQGMVFDLESLNTVDMQIKEYYQNFIHKVKHG